jgi:hypothetical protein
MYLDHDLFKSKIQRLHLIDSLANLREWFTVWPRKELSREMYAWVGDLIIMSAKNLGYRMVHLSYDERHDHCRYKKDGNLVINIMKPSIQLCDLLELFEQKDVNIYDVLFDDYNKFEMFPEEDLFLIESIDTFKVRPKYVVDGTPKYNSWDRSLDRLRTY